MMASPSPAALAWPRITSVSKAFKRQPKVSSCGWLLTASVSVCIGSAMAGSGQGLGQSGKRDLAIETMGPAAGHAHMIIGQPGNVEPATIQQDIGATAGETAPGGRHQGGAGTAATSLRDAGTALPDSHAQIAIGQQLDDLDISAFRKQRMMFEKRPPMCQIDGGDIRHEEDRMRIADIDTDRIAEWAQ